MEDLVKMMTAFILAAAVLIGPKDKPAFQYQYEDVPFKPYVSQLYTPAGIGVLRDNVPDHKHHHGLMFAVAVNGVDFWSEYPVNGKEITEKFTKNDTGLVELLSWKTPSGELLLRERRTVTVQTGPVTLLTWESRLMPPGTNGVKLTGAHYFGLGMRFVESMDKVAEFSFSTNDPVTVVRGSEKVFPANWCACTGPVEGKTVTVAVFDAPGNPRRPATMFTMNVPFAYMSATLNLWKEPLTVKEPLDLRYGVALWDGRPTREQIEEVYQRWSKP
jgi:hypothetical protein